MKLIVGLGNPGKQHGKTRHNIGWVILDKLVETLGLSLSDFKNSNNAQAYYLKTKINGEEIEFLKPNNFMNNSGFAVQYAFKKHPELNPESDLFVIHDDKDIPLGEIKIQKDKSSAGHNGVQSIINHIKTQDFTRVRVGVAPVNPKHMGDTAKFVLKKFGMFEKKKVNEVVSKAIKEIENFI